MSRFDKKLAAGEGVVGTFSHLGGPSFLPFCERLWHQIPPRFWTRRYLFFHNSNVL